MKITQKDIAKKLKISVATVSRALRNDTVINAEIRGEVIAMAAKLGYHPKGKQIYSGIDDNTDVEHKFIGVIIKIPIEQDAWAPDEIAQGYLSGMSEISTELNVSIVVHHVSDKNVDDLINPARLPPMMRDEAISGLILIHHIPPHIVLRLSGFLPCTSIVHDVPAANIDHIDMDNYNAIQALMDMLYKAGHRKIGFIGFRPYLSWSNSRMAAYIQFMVKKGLSYDPELIQEEIDMNFTKKKIKQGVTAWVCSIDSIGYDLCRKLIDSGYNIPKDVSVVGFNGVAPLLNCSQLTTVKAPLKAMGALALNRLMIRIKDPMRYPLTILHRCEIMKGKSVARPRF